MTLLGGRTEEPGEKLFEPNLKAEVKNQGNDELEQDSNYLKEQVQPQLEMAKQICEDELL